MRESRSPDFSLAWTPGLWYKASSPFPEAEPACEYARLPQPHSSSASS